MPKSLDLGFGILMVLTGLYCFACILMARKRYAALENAGSITPEQVRSKIKGLKLVGVSNLVVGAGLICIYLFRLY
jgi:uncharacterized protein YjeT (DUF2065 family)